MTEKDPAAARFASIQFTRLLGVAFVLGGIWVATGRTPLPEWVGYLLIANGLVDVFVLPLVLARKWRMPK